MLNFLLLATMLPQTAQTTPAAWTYKETTDAPTGKKSATAQIRATDGSGRLIVRCDTVAVPIVSVQYIPNPRLTASESHSVTLTVDEAGAEISNWESPGAGLYRGEPYDVFLFASKIATAKTIRIDTTNDAGQPIESVFEGPGNDALFRQVYGVCGIPYELPKVGLTPS